MSSKTLTKPNNKWLSAFSAYTDRRAIVLFLLGFSAGIPILLIFSSLSLWLREAGVSRSTVTMFSWAALGYSFKFVWAPLIDSLPVPFLTKMLGKRRAWLLLSQIGVVAAIVTMSMVDPVLPASLKLMAAAAVLLGFSSATQDIVIDAYRIEIAPDDSALQSVSAAMYVAGYRLAMIVSGAGTLYLAALWGSSKASYLYSAWQQAYLVMAMVMAVGIATTLWIREPALSQQDTVKRDVSDNLKLLFLFIVAASAFVATFILLGKYLPSMDGALPKFLRECMRMLGSILVAIVAGFILVSLRIVPQKLAADTSIAPISDFFQRYGSSALLVLALVGLYRISDIVVGVISNVFYQDVGFTKAEIAGAVKTFGVIMTIVGGFVGGVLAQRIHLMTMMMIGAILASATNLLFILLTYTGTNLGVLYFAVGFDNLAAGLASTVFIAFLSALTNIRFTTVQYAIFSSLMTLLPKVLGGYSGMIVETVGYTNFFVFTAVLGIPVLILIGLAAKRLEFKVPK